MELGPLLCTWEHDFTHAGIPVRQHEHIYLVRGPHREPIDDVAAAHAEDKILRWRWWTPRELTVPADPLWPPQLPALLTRLHSTDGPAPTPIDLGYVPNAEPQPEADDSRHDEAARLSRPSQRLKNKLRACF